MMPPEPNKPPEAAAYNYFNVAETAALRRLVAERVLPGFYDTITWALHETGRDYTTEARQEVATALLTILSGALLVGFTDATLAADKTLPASASDELFQYHADALLGVMSENLGVRPLDTPPPEASEAEMLLYRKTHFDALFRQLNKTIDVMSTDATPKASVGQLMLAALFAEMAERFDFRNDDTKIAKWLHAMLKPMVKDLKIEVTTSPPSA